MITLQCVTEPELEVNPLVQYHPKSQNSGMEVCQENSKQCYCLHGYNPHTFYIVSKSFFILLSSPMSMTFKKLSNQTLQQLQGINLSSAFFPSNMKKFHHVSLSKCEFYIKLNLERFWVLFIAIIANNMNCRADIFLTYKQL